MSLALRRLFLLLVVTAVGFAGAPVHAGGLVPSHHGPIDQAIEHHEHQHDGARHDHSADVGCVESGHCFPVQLIFCSRIYAAEALPPNAWDMPDDIRATSLKPEASTPPPRSA